MLFVHSFFPQKNNKVMYFTMINFYLILNSKKMNQNNDNREQNILNWQKELLIKENKIRERVNELKAYENNLFLLEERMKLEKHCLCCSKFDQKLPSDTIYAEWGVFKRVGDSEHRIGLTSIGEVYLSQTILNVFLKCINTPIGKNFSNYKLVAIFVTKLDLGWSANDWRMVDDFNSKLIICEKSGRKRIKFIIEE